MLRGHRRHPGALRLGLPAPDPAPADRRGTVAATSTATRRELENELFDERFLLARPVLRALRESPCVLLIDEIDRADDEFEAFLLEVLSTWQVTCPRSARSRARTPPIVVLTSNRTRELHDALKRRCLYHWIDHPGLARELEIVRTRLPEVPAVLAEQVVGVIQRLRNDGRPHQATRASPRRSTGPAPSIPSARAALDPEVAAATLGAAVKYREDAERVRAMLDNASPREARMTTGTTA